MTVQGRDFKSLRQWDGSQHRAFEEFCYQLRDPTPEGADLTKTGNPDGGLEWYVTLRNGVQWGWQAKFTPTIEKLLKLMEKSLTTVVQKRPKCRRLTFCIPFDLSDAVGPGKRKSARQKFEDGKKSWCRRIPGAERVHIDLWSAGDILQRLVGHWNQRGIEKFFWNKEVFSPDWCKQRLDYSVKAAGGRYSPELHIDPSVAFAIEGLAQSEAYWQRYRALRDGVVNAATYLRVSDYVGIGVTRKLQHLNKLLAEWQREVPSRIDLPARLDPEPLCDATRAVRTAVDDAYPHDSLPDPKRRKTTRGQEDVSERSRSLRRYLHGLLAAIQDFEDLMKSSATKAAAHGALLLTGEAGQGKTHLFCHAARCAVDGSHPAILLLGGQLSGRNVWSQIAERLGLGQVGSEVLIGAMQAVAEASKAPFLLLIDAINEAEDPRAWQSELPGLLADVAENPWISIGVSVRSTYREITLPPEWLSNNSKAPDIAKVEHRGLSGRELEAAEQFFGVFGLQQPGTPLLTPEFTNPLFLKLYCEGLRAAGPDSTTAGEVHISEVFERYLQSRADLIANQLRLDPAARPVQSAIDAFCKALADANRDTLARSDATNIVSEFAPGRDQWPDTMMGALLSEGVLTADVAWDSESASEVEVIRFTYQRFADYRIGSGLLGSLEGDPKRLGEALADGKPLRRRLEKAPVGWIEALSVQTPEQFGVELLEAAKWSLDSFRRRQWEEAFVRSIAARRRSAVAPRTRELLGKVWKQSPNLSELILETILSVAPSPGHWLNADFLHESLKKLPMPPRDVAWSIPTYGASDYGGALDRLIRWAARGPYPDCSNEVVELASVPIVWAFTSPNRRLRDYATKALSRLLSGHLPVLPSLIRRFDGVDDPYVIERLAVVSHGAVLCGGSAATQAAVATGEELKRVVLNEAQVPNVIARDTVRGVFEWCADHDLMDRKAYREVLPPYGAAPPGKPRTEKQLERKYDGRMRRTSGIGKSYGTLFTSLFYLGDFRKYVIGAKLRHFSQLTITRSRGLRRDAREYPTELGARWVFERVLSLGWTPDKFAEFDARCHSRLDGEHKAERFGKKYQWIALRELIARISDNFHMTDGDDHQPVTYAGPWQFSGRDIDPTLPPAPRIRNEDDGFDLRPTFPFPSSEDRWWIPQGPQYRRDDPPVAESWAHESGDIPEFKPLVRRKDERGMRWVVLHAVYHWDDDDVMESGENRSKPHRRLWGHIYSWLVQPAERDSLVAYLERHSLMGRWMPEGRVHTDAAYLGELPWAAAADEYPDSWQEIPPRGRSEQVDAKVYPAWEDYYWEDNVLDCSIDDSVRASFPAPVLFRSGRLRWVPGTREWRIPSGETVARYLEGDGHMALLVREDWLKRTLRQSGHCMVFGWLGEKQLVGTGPHHGLVGGWMEINAIASLVVTRWTFGERRLKRCSLPVQ